MVGLTRRQTLVYCGCAASSFLLPKFASAQLGCGSYHIAACSLQQAERDALDSVLTFVTEDNGKYKIPDTKSSSDIEGFDQAYGRVLNRLANIFDCRPQFSYLREAVGVKNAFAVSHSDSNGNRGEILFGINLLNSYLNLPKNGDMIVLSVSAHEFAHIKQFEQRERMKQLLGGSPCHYIELHADFVSGYGLEQYYRLYLNSSSGLQEIGAAWEQLGSSDYNNPGTHGTSSERIAAIQAGYSYSRRNKTANVWNAMSAGIDYLRRS